MESFFSIILVCLFAACPASKHQVSKLESPQPSYRQMLEDHHTLVCCVRQRSPVIHYNKEVRGADSIKKVSAVFQNNVAHPVDYAVGYLQLRSTAKEDIYGMDFLLTTAQCLEKYWNLKTVNK